MRLDPHPKPVRIRLSIDQQNGSGKIVYFGLDDLLKNFDFESLVPHIVDQSLMRWLEQLGQKDITKQIKQILETELDDNDGTKSQEIEKFANLSEQIIEQNKFRIISSLFGGVINDKINSDKDFLSALLNLKLSSEYKSSIKNVLESPAFSEYSAYESLNSLLQGCDTALGKLVEKQLEFLLKKENERKERIAKQEREQKEKQEREARARIEQQKRSAKMVHHKNQFDDTILKVYYANGQRVRKGDKIITLRREDIIAKCDGIISRIVLPPGLKYYDYVCKGRILVSIIVE